MQQIERDCFSVAKRRSIYIYDVSISGFTRSSIYIYDISSLRVNILSIRVHMAKKCTEGLAVVSKATGLAVNVDKTQYMVMSGDQTAGRSYNMKTDNSSFERVEQFRYLGITVTNKIPFMKKLSAV